MESILFNSSFFFQTFQEYLLEKSLEILISPGSKNESTKDECSEVSDVEHYVQILFENSAMDAQTLFSSETLNSEWISLFFRVGVIVVFFFRLSRRNSNLVDFLCCDRMQLAFRRRKDVPEVIPEDRVYSRRFGAFRKSTF